MTGKIGFQKRRTTRTETTQLTRRDKNCASRRMKILEQLFYLLAACAGPLYCPLRAARANHLARSALAQWTGKCAACSRPVAVMLTTSGSSRSIPVNLSLRELVRKIRTSHPWQLPKLHRLSCKKTGPSHVKRFRQVRSISTNIYMP